MTIISPGEVQIKLAAFIRQRRLSREMTQQEMAQRSGVPLSTLRKFEQKGQVSLEHGFSCMFTGPNLGS